MQFAFCSLLVFLFDLSAMIVAWGGGFLLRFNFEIPETFLPVFSWGLVCIMPIHMLACYFSGLYRGIWVFASLPDLRRVLRAIIYSTLGLLLFSVIYKWGQQLMPRSLLVLYPLLLAAYMGGGRAFYRMWKEHRLYGGLVAQGKPVLIVGAGNAGAALLKDLEKSPDWRVVGLVDDDQSKWGRELSGRPIFGGIEHLPQIITEQKARHVILAMPSSALSARRLAADLAVAAGAHVFTVPAVDDLMSGRVSVSSIRPVVIEDLLGREPVWIDTPNVAAMLHGKTVLVTGAGGSIGGELCRQLANFSPACLVLFEQNEFSLYSIEQWFLYNFPRLQVVALAGDVKDESRVGEVFTAHRPQIVFHAAAYKHVPLMEVGNAWQAVQNNVLGTLRVAECARAHGAERFVLISTDKAVNPTSVMGASKRLAEMVCEAIYAAGGGLHVEMVRFGNVLGSTGSVIPKFKEQIEHGGPVTVTHPEITRYFMSIPEAAQLVLQAATMGHGGEIFVMDMGEPVKIVDLARKLIHLSGFSEDDIRIEFTGLRSGEKLYEELLADTEHTRETPHPKLRIARARPVEENFLETLQSWLKESCQNDSEVRLMLTRLVSEYRPTTNSSAQ